MNEKALEEAKTLCTALTPADQIALVRHIIDAMPKRVQAFFIRRRRELTLFELLTRDLHAKVFQHLGISTLGKCLLVSATWCETIEKNTQIWKQLSSEAGYAEIPQLSTTEQHMQNVRRKRISDRAWSTMKHVRRASAVLAKKSPIIITQHMMTSALLIVGTNVGKIFVWNTETRTLLVHAHHRSGVWAFDLSDNLLVSGGCDKRILVYDLARSTLVKELGGHKSIIRSIKISKKYIYSGSRDGTIKIWSLDRLLCENTIKVHTDTVKFLVPLQGGVASASYDGTVRFHAADSVEAGPSGKTLMRAGNGRVYALCSTSQFVIAGFETGTIVVHRRGKNIVLVDAHDSVIIALYIHKTSLYSGDISGRISKWCLVTMKKIYDIECGILHSFACDGHRIVCGGRASIDVFDAQSGTFVCTLASEIKKVFHVAVYCNECSATVKTANGDTVVLLFRI